MTISKLAFELHAGLKEAHGINIKRSHIYEVLASLFGLASFASLSSRRLFAQHDLAAPRPPLDARAAELRAAALGYTRPSAEIISALIASQARELRLCTVDVDHVLRALGIEEANQGPEDLRPYGPDSKARAADAGSERELALDLDSVILRESLDKMAAAGSAHAHLALANLDQDLIAEEEGPSVDGRYWFEQQQAGYQLAGVELEWAEAHRRAQQVRSSRAEHLSRAASLGSLEAALQRAEAIGDDESYAQAMRLADGRHASRLGVLALSLGRDADALRWLRTAAERGDTSAMHVLASELETDPKEAWTWVYLAEMLGDDPTETCAVDEDGLPADADEAGPIYAAGGLELEALSNEEDRMARRRAKTLYEALSR